MNRPKEERGAEQSEASGFTEGPIKTHIMRLGGVMIYGFLAMTLAQLVEVSYLGVIGKEVLAAIAFSFPVVMAMGAMTRGIGVGASTLIARAMGEGNRDNAALLTTHCYLLVVVFTVGLSPARKRRGILPVLAVGG